MPANFKTYEAQARLLAAVIAAHPELKLNYKAISDHYGKSQSTSAIEHRFRPLRSAAQVLRDLVQSGQDPDIIEDILDKNAIAKYFGESTADGIQFQFRGVKTAAENLKRTVESGGNPATALPAGKPAVAATPRKRARAEPKSVTKPVAKSNTWPKTLTPSGKTDASTVGFGNSSTKRRTAKNTNYKESSNEDDSTSLDYDDLDSDSPSKYVKKVRATPSKFPSPAQLAQRDGQPASAPRPAAVIDNGTSTSESSIQTPDNSGNDEVTFLKQEAVNTNSAVSFPSITQQQQLRFSSFSQSSQGDSFRVSNDGSFLHPPQSIFGGPSRAAPVNAQNSFPALDPRPGNVVQSSENLSDAFGGRDISWSLNSDVIFESNYYDNDNNNGDI